MLSRKHPTFEVIPYTLPIGKGETKTSRWEEQIRILGDDDMDEGNTRYSNFSFEEGLVWVSEEESYPEEDPLIYYDPEEDMFAYEPSDAVNVVDGPEYDSYTSGTFYSYCCSRLPNFEDEILIRMGDCNNPDFLSRVKWSFTTDENG
jgi:hypothetical protein